ncbi:MAG: 3'-5' exonuclease [Zavarzinella sp.]
MSDDREELPPEKEIRFLVFDIESIPDGNLIKNLRYQDTDLTDAEAVQRAQEEARETSYTSSDFLPYSQQIPICMAIILVNRVFEIAEMHVLGLPEHNTRQLTEFFWRGRTKKYRSANLVTFNGRGFDLPMMELMAFRFGLPIASYYQNRGSRYNTDDLDLYDWITNYGASRLTGGLNLLAKMIGKPGKMSIAGENVYEMYLDADYEGIQGYCLCDTLDTYFVFLRRCVLLGTITPDYEQQVVEKARAKIALEASRYPILNDYLACWADALGDQ